MSMEEYLKQLESLLRVGRMAPPDIEDAVLRCGQHIVDAGPEHEAEVLADLGTPEELAQEILEDYRRNMDRRRRGGGLPLALKIVLGIFLSPFIVGAYGIVFSFVVGGAVCVITGGFYGVVGLGTLLPSGLGTFLNFVGSGFLAAGLGLLLCLAGVMFCKLSNFCMRRLFGGRRTAI